jgi:hypothetical protein
MDEAKISNKEFKMEEKKLNNFIKNVEEELEGTSQWIRQFMIGKLEKNL